MFVVQATSRSIVRRKFYAERLWATIAAQISWTTVFASAEGNVNVSIGTKPTRCRSVHTGARCIPGRLLKRTSSVQLK